MTISNFAQALATFVLKQWVPFVASRRGNILGSGIAVTKRKEDIKAWVELFKPD